MLGIPRVYVFGPSTSNQHRVTQTASKYRRQLSAVAATKIAVAIQETDGVA